MKESLTLKNVGIFLIAAIILLLLDRTIKELFIQYYTQDIIIFPNILEFTLAENKGVAFGIGLPYATQMILFPALLVLGIYVVLNYLDYKKLSVQLITGFIAGGALSNFIDRIIYHHVIDYVSINIYPVFNLADVAISVGIFILVVFYGKMKRV